MPGMINLAAGLSSAGNAVADFAGRAGLEAQRAQYDTERIRLADSLATVREESTDARRNKYATDAADTAFGRQKELKGIDIQAQKDKEARDLENAPKLIEVSKKAEAGVIKTLGEDPDYLAAVKKIKEAGTTDEDRARTGLLLQQTAEATVKTEMAKTLSAAHKDLDEATKANDPVRIEAAKQTIRNAEFGSTEERQRASASASVIATLSRDVSSTEALISSETVKLGTILDDGDKKMVNDNITRLKSEADQLRQQLRLEYNRYQSISGGPDARKPILQTGQAQGNYDWQKYTKGGVIKPATKPSQPGMINMLMDANNPGDKGPIQIVPRQ